MRPSQVAAIVVHCSATPPNAGTGVDAIRRYHVEHNGWADIGYHYVITTPGAVEPGRPTSQQGAHCKDGGYNPKSIGVCLVGGLDADGRPANNFAPQQFDALWRLIQVLRGKFPTITEVLGHRDTGANKACPCFDVRGWLRTREAKNQPLPGCLVVDGGG